MTPPVFKVKFQTQIAIRSKNFGVKRTRKKVFFSDTKFYAHLMNGSGAAASWKYPKIHRFNCRFRGLQQTVWSICYLSCLHRNWASLFESSIIHFDCQVRIEVWAFSHFSPAFGRRWMGKLWQKIFHADGQTMCAVQHCQVTQFYFCHGARRNARRIE